MMDPLENASSIELRGGITESNDVGHLYNNAVTGDNLMVATWDRDNTNEFNVGKYIQDYQYNYSQYFSESFDPTADISLPYYESKNDYLSNNISGYTNLIADKDPPRTNKGACFWIVPSEIAYPTKYMGFGWSANAENDIAWNYFYNYYDTTSINPNDFIIIEECPKCTLFNSFDVKLLNVFKSKSTSYFHGLHWHILWASKKDEELSFGVSYLGKKQNQNYDDVYLNSMLPKYYDKWILSAFVKTSDLDTIKNDSKVSNIVINGSSTSSIYKIANGWTLIFIILNYENPEVINYLNNFDNADISISTPREARWMKNSGKYKFFITVGTSTISKEYTENEFNTFAKVEDGKCILTGTAPDSQYTITGNDVYIPEMDRNLSFPRRFNSSTGINIVKYSGVKFIKLQQ